MEVMSPAARESYLIMRKAMVRAPASIIDSLDKGFDLPPAGPAVITRVHRFDIRAGVRFASDECGLMLL